MPLKAYQRPDTPIWWAKGRIECEGHTITDYLRFSTGALTEAEAWIVINDRIDRERRKYLLGEQRAFTWDEAVMLYDAKPKEAGFLIRLHDHLSGKMVSEIFPQMVRDLCPKVYPKASTDTWRRQVITPISAVINNAHDLGKCAPIKIKGFTTQQRIDQDHQRGRQSRPKIIAGDWQWIDSLRGHASDHVIAGLELMFETGCRVTQMTSLQPHDVDLKNNQVWMIAQKGHPAQWVKISHSMMITLANLPPKRPTHVISGQKGLPKVFGFADRTGYTNALKRACKAAGVDYRSPHAAGRHGFYTELTVRQGLSRKDAAHHGRWSGTKLPDTNYAHSEASEADARDAIRTNRVQAKPAKGAS